MLPESGIEQFFLIFNGYIFYMYRAYARATVHDLPVLLSCKTGKAKDYEQGGIIMERQVYMASDIQKALGLGKTKTYEFLKEVYEQKEPPFRVIKVGNSLRVFKQSFDNWVNAVNS